VVILLVGGEKGERSFDSIEIKRIKRISGAQVLTWQLKDEVYTGFWERGKTHRLSPLVIREGDQGGEFKGFNNSGARGP